MKKVNYHTHTPRCKHALGSEETYIQAAVEAGITDLGFSDHCPYQEDSSMRMSLSEFPSYVRTLQTLKEKYKDHIRIYIGLECEYFPRHIDFIQNLVKQYELDYIILGHHFYRDEDGHYFGYQTNDKDILHQYVEEAIKAVSTGMYSYLAHPDLIHFKPTHSDIYNQEMRCLCEACKDYGVPLEFNLLGYRTHRWYPEMNYFWPIVAEVGNEVIIGYDAHEPNSLGDDKAYMEAVAFLQDLHINIIDEIPLHKIR